MSSPESDLAALLPPLRAAAREAGRVILRFYNEGTTVSNKADGSPVTEADRAAEAVILPVLRSLTPNWAAVAEEDSAINGKPVVTSRFFWLVDPLDGTKEFIKRNGEFTVNIGLIDGDTPVLGVIYVPVTGEMYTGVGPGTAIAATADGPDRPIRARTIPPEGVTVAESRSHRAAEATERWLAGRPIASKLSRGSSLKFCAVASGEADVYPRFGPTHEWDTAAGHAIVSAAGGRVENIDGGPLVYRKPEFLNGSFVVLGA